MQSIVELARDASSPRHPQDALRAVSLLRTRLSQLEEYHVRRALALGDSWSEIGRALGVSKQAAHQRFAGRAPRPGIAREGAITVTGVARAAVRLARREAGAAGRRTAGPEHLLLGLLALPVGRAREVLVAEGVELDRARALLGVRNDESKSTAGVSARGRVVLERALDEAVRLGHEELNDTHLLLSLLHHGGASVHAVVERLGSSPERILERLAGGD